MPHCQLISGEVRALPGAPAPRPGALLQRFRALGVSATQTRTAAFRQLVPQAPAPVVAHARILRGGPRAVVPSARPTVRGYSIRHSRIRQPTGFISPRLLAAAMPPARHASPASALRSPILVRCCRPCQPAETCAISAAPCAFSAIFFIAQRDAIWCRGSLMAGVMCLGVGWASVRSCCQAGSHHRPEQGRIRRAAACGFCGPARYLAAVRCIGRRWGSPSRRGIMVRVPGLGVSGAGVVRGAARMGRLAAGLAGFRAAARRPVTCTGAVAGMVTELAAGVKPAVPGGSLAGPRRPRRPR